MKLKWTKQASGSFAACGGALVLGKEPWAAKGEPGAWVLSANGAVTYFRTKAEAQRFAQAFADVLIGGYEQQAPFKIETHNTSTARMSHRVIA